MLGCPPLLFTFGCPLPQEAETFYFSFPRLPLFFASFSSFRTSFSNSLPLGGKKGRASGPLAVRDLERDLERDLSVAQRLENVSGKTGPVSCDCKRPFQTANARRDAVSIPVCAPGTALGARDAQCMCLEGKNRESCR